MHTVNMLEAKSSLSRLVQAVESGEEAEFIIARNGQPAARLVPLQGAAVGQRLGVAKGVFLVPDTIDEPMRLVTRDPMVALYSEQIVKI